MVLRPRFLVVNVGRGKLLSYGHPAVRTLARLALLGYFYSRCAGEEAAAQRRI